MKERRIILMRGGDKLITTFSNSYFAEDAIRGSGDMSSLALTGLIDNLVNLFIGKIIGNVKKCVRKQCAIASRV